MMTTPCERTKAVTDTRELLTMLARADEITIGGLVQTVALGLLRHYPLDIDLDVSAAALPGIWAASAHRQAGSTTDQQCKKVPHVRTILTMFAAEERMMTARHVVPDDFPREPAPGVLAGAQPKLLVRGINGRYYTALTDDELWTRYDACEDLAGQLVEYVSRKMSMPGLALDDVLGRVEKGVKAKVSDCVWDFSPAEITWVIKRTRELLSEATGGGGVHHDR